LDLNPQHIGSPQVAGEFDKAAPFA